MADWTKAADGEVLIHDEVTHPIVVEGSTVNVAADDAVTINLYHAVIEATANTNPGSFLIQLSTATSGDEEWSTAMEIATSVLTPSTSALDSGGEAPGQTDIGIAATAGIVAGEWVYIQDTTTDTDGEWVFVTVVATNDYITILDGIANAKDNADVTWSDAEVWAVNVDVHSVNRLRVLYVHVGATGANTAIKATMSRATDYE